MTEPGTMPEPDRDGPSVDDPAPQPPVEKKAASRLDKLRERRRELREERESLKLEIPGYSDTLVAAYRVLDFEETRKLRRKGEQMAANNNPNAELWVTCDTIALACVGFFVRDEDGELSPLNEEDERFGEEPIRYERRLAEIMEVDSESVRVLIREMFPTDLSILAHLAEISRWMESNRESDDEVFSTPS